MENETQERRDQNYNARMDWWNEVRGSKGPISDATGCIVFIGILMGIGIIGAIVTAIFK